MNDRMRSQNKSLDLRNLPVWCQPEAPLGSAVRYLASLSSKFDCVGINPGPSLGVRAKGSVLRVSIQGRKGQVLGHIEVSSRQPGAFGAEEEKMVTTIAEELGHVWPE